MSKPHRNSPERAAMLARRAHRQFGRIPGFTPMFRKPRGHVGKWDPAGHFSPRPSVPAWMNRRTGKPHENRRQRDGGR